MNKTQFDLLCWIWIALAIVLLPLLLRITQPYGKHAKPGWGPTMGNKLAWFIMELPALLVVVYFVARYSNPKNIIVLTAAALWCIHYLHRSLIYPFTLKAKGKRMAVLIVFFGIVFNLCNGYFNAYWLTNFAPDLPDNSLLNFRILLGIAIFFMGFAINKYHDRLLISLRKNTDSDYKIPRGGLFKHVSCPNFLGEMISWLGFFIVTLSLPALSFLVWTMVNLIPRALDHHKWYRNKFPDYPKTRKAIFPKIL